MDYKLSEEQSTEFSTNMFVINKYARDINTKTVSIVKRWYQSYIDNKKWYHLTRNFDSFLKAISTFDGLEIRDSSMGYRYIGYKANNGWCSGFKIRKIVELTGIPESEIRREAEEAWETITFMYNNQSFLYKNCDIMEDFRLYCKIPYTLDNSTLHHMKKCKELVESINSED